MAGCIYNGDISIFIVEKGLLGIDRDPTLSFLGIVV